MTPPPVDRSAWPDDPRAALLLPLLVAAGREALGRLDSAQVQLKADDTKVTDADLAAHEVLLAGLSAAFPGEQIVSEEDGSPVPPGPGPVWYIDPLDGTGAFTEGLPYWGPTAVRVVDGRPDFGAFWAPRLGESWFASAEGAWLGRRRLAAHDPPLDDHSILLLPSRAHRAGRLQWPGRVRGLGCTAAHLALVAAGGCSATIIPQWRPWDIGCGLLLLTATGKRVTDLSGTDFDPMLAPDTPFIAAAPNAVAALVEMLAPVAAKLPRAHATRPGT